MSSKKPSSKVTSYSNSSYSIEDFQKIITGLLDNLNEIFREDIFENDFQNLTFIDSILHFMTDVETQMTIAREILEQERLIFNNLIE